MLIDFKLGQGSIVLRVKLRNSSVSTGAGLAGLTSVSTGLVIAVTADNEQPPAAGSGAGFGIAYTVAGSTIESITTLGTYAAPTATKARFKEVDATNHKGIYEVQIVDTRFNTAGAKSVLISISGATNLAECDVLIPLRSVDPYSAAAFITGVNGLVPPTRWNLLAIDANGRVDVSKVLGAAQTAGDLAALLAAVAGYIDTEITDIKAKTDLIPPDPADASDIAALLAALPAGLLDLAGGIEAGMTLRQGLRLILSAAAGKTNGMATATNHLRDTSDAKNRITATTDTDGNRTAVTYDTT
jgi:hypothetical protein